MQKAVVAVVAGAVVVAGGWYLVSSGRVQLGGDSVVRDNAGDVVARVNREEITRDTLDAFIAQTVATQGSDVASLDAEVLSAFERDAVETLISQALLRQAATVSSMNVSAEDVEGQVSAIVSQFENRDAFAAALTAQGLTEEDFRVQVEMDIATQAFLNERLDLDSLVATEEEVTALYAQLAAGGGDGEMPALAEVREQVESLVIQQKQQGLLNELVEELRAEADIEVLM